MTGFQRESRSVSNAARRCLVRLVSTEPWLICETGGLRFLGPDALAVDGSTAEHGSVFVADWAFSERAAARGCIDLVTRESSIATMPVAPGDTVPSQHGPDVENASADDRAPLHERTWTSATRRLSAEALRALSSEKCTGRGILDTARDAISVWGTDVVWRRGVPPEPGADGLVWHL
jgi:hypothetical protein